MKNKNYTKKCKKCSQKEIIKFGFKRRKQRYKCKSCNYIFINKSRNKQSTPFLLWKDFSFGKQTYKQLSKKYNISIKTAQKLLKDKSIDRFLFFMCLNHVSFRYFTIILEGGHFYLNGKGHFNENFNNKKDNY